ncbi:hypothetical protein EDB83DRAFT_2318726 [Lactarius deliciosus]|nr:hypothetical protein EDB83DRAFT_2318726 [Lactarius deliciosus]
MPSDDSELNESDSEVNNDCGITSPKRKVPRESRFPCHHKTGIPEQHSSPVCFTLIVLWRTKTGGRERRETARPPVRRVGRRRRFALVRPFPREQAAREGDCGAFPCPRRPMAACSHTTPFRANRVARTWGKGKGRRGTGSGVPSCTPSARTGWRGDGRGGRCALHPFRANGVTRTRGEGRPKRRRGVACVVRPSSGRIGEGWDRGRCAVLAPFPRDGGQRTLVHTRSARMGRGPVREEGGTDVPSCAPLLCECGANREREGAEETGRRTACRREGRPGGMGRRGRGVPSHAPLPREWDGRDMGEVPARLRVLAFRADEADVEEGQYTRVRPPPFYARRGGGQCRGRGRGTYPREPLSRRERGSARCRGRGRQPALLRPLFDTNGAGEGVGVLRNRKGSRKGPVRTPWRKQNVPATYAYVAGTFCVGRPLLPSRPPRPPHSCQNGDARGQADTLPLPMHRAQNEGAQGKRTRKGGGAQGHAAPPSLPLPHICAASSARNERESTRPPSLYPLFVPPHSRGKRAHDGTPPPSPCHPRHSLSQFALEGVHDGTPPPFLSLSPPDPPFHPVRAAPFARMGGGGGTTTRCSPFPRPLLFPHVRATPFVRKEGTRRHTSTTPLSVTPGSFLSPHPRRPVRAEGVQGTPPPSPIPAPPRSRGRGARGHTAPHPPSALTLPPCPRHPVRAEWGRARASRHGAARTGEGATVPFPRSLFTWKGAHEGEPPPPPHASHRRARGLPAFVPSHFRAP